MKPHRFTSGASAVLMSILFAVSAPGCSSVHMDEVLDTAGEIAEGVAEVVKDAIEDDDAGGSSVPTPGAQDSGGQVVSRPPRPTGTLTTGTETPLASASVSPAGGTLLVNLPGDPLDGLELQVPEGAYPDTRNFDISTAPVTNHSFGEHFTPATPLITVMNGGGYSDEFMTMRIPIDLPPDHFAMAFYYDEAAGTLEGIPFKSLDGDSITIVTRHFSSIIVSIIRNTVLDDLMKSDIDSHFRPGIDDWQFTNYGSYIAKGGHCAGQCLTELWYFCQQPDGQNLTLNGRYDRNGEYPPTPELWYDDSYGYRFASMVHEDINWDSFENELMADLAGKDDELTFKAFAYAIQLTGEPQEVGIYASAGGGHDMICYRITKNSLYIADPNYPGNTERRIEYSNGHFKPYESGANAAEIAAGNSTTYETIEYCAKTATIDWNIITTRWNEFRAGTIGNGTFPQYEIVVHHDDGSEEALTDGSESEQKKINIRVKANCPTAWVVYRDGAKLVPDANDKRELVDGNNLLGIVIYGDINNNPQDRKWRYIDFQYINVQHGEEECYGWMLESVTTKEYYEMPSDPYYQDLAFQASESGSFSGSGHILVYDDDIYARHETAGTWTPPPSCIPPNEPVYLDMHCASSLVFDQNVDWGTIYTYLNIGNGSYSMDYGRINQELDNTKTTADDSAVAEIQLYEGFEGIAPEKIIVQCGTQEGGAEYVYTYVWKG